MIISGDSMKVAAEKHNAKFVSLPAFARNAKLTDKVVDADLIAKIFSMDVGTESEVIELKNGFVILRVDNVNAEHNAEFADIKKDLIKDWKMAEQRKQAYVKANESLVDLNKNGNLKNAISANVSRTEGAPISVLNATFAGVIGENKLVEGEDAFYVLHIDKNIVPKADNAKKAELRKELEKMSGRFVMDDFSQYLKRHYPVKIKEKNYKRFVVK